MNKKEETDAKNWVEKLVLNEVALEELKKDPVPKEWVNFSGEQRLTPIMRLAQVGALDKMEWLKNKGADLTAVDSNDKNVLMHAIEKGHEHVVKRCLEWGMPLGHRTFEGWTALMFAASGKNRSIVQRLLKAGCSVKDETIHERNVLMMNVLWGDDCDESVGILEDLIQAGADLNKVDIFGNTSLIYLVDKNSKKKMEIVLRQGVLINQKNHQFKTALDIVVENGSMEMMEMLIACGAVFMESGEDHVLNRAIRYGHYEIAKNLIEREPLLIQKNVQRESLLSLAIKAPKHELKMVKMLLEKGVDTQRWREQDEEPLHEAIFWKKLSVIKCLVKAGANIKAKDRWGKNGLFIAIEASEDWVNRIPAESTLDYLIKMGVPIDEQKEVQEKQKVVKSHTPLMQAIEVGNPRVAQWLLNKGAQAGLRTIKNKTALMLAAEKGYKELVHALIEKGASIHDKDDDGNTSLMHAARKGKKEVVKALLEWGGMVNEKNKKGRTALMLAVEKGSMPMPCVKLLLAHGAQIDLKDKQGQTALDLGKKRKHDELTALLEAAALDALCSRQKDLSGPSVKSMRL